MTQEQMEYLIMCVVFVGVTTVICAVIGGLFSWKLGLAFGLFQFVLTMCLTRKRIGWAERYPEEQMVV